MARLLVICTIAFLLLVWLPVGLIVGYIQLIGMKVKKHGKNNNCKDTG